MNSNEKREFLLHGLRIRCDFQLAADEFVGAPTEGAPFDGVTHNEFPVITVLVVDALGDSERSVEDADLFLNWCEPADPPEEAVTLHRLPDNSWLFSYAGIQFVFNSALDCVTVVIRAHDEPAWVQVLFEGWVLSVLVTLRGGSVLHASSVMLGNQLVAMVGNSGQGKSTLAALLCVTGGQLFSDDVLSVNTAGSQGGITCHRGSNSLRLRPDAAGHPALKPLGEQQLADDRMICRLARDVDDVVPISAIVIPHVLAIGEVSDDTEPWQVTPFSPVDAVVELLSYPRTYHWLKAEHQIAAFELAAVIASHVPVFRFTLPYGYVDPQHVRAVIVELLRTSVSVTP